MIKILNVNKQGNRIISYTCTDDNQTSELTKEQVIQLIKNKQISNATLQYYNNKPIIRIKDNTKINKEVPTIVCGEYAVGVLNKLLPGTPLMIEIQGQPYEQVIYSGIGNVQSQQAYRFFNGEGFSGGYAFSPQYITRSGEKIKFKFNDNDPNKVAQLISQIKLNTI